MSYADAYDPSEGVAIVGCAGRFPGARSIAEFWQLLVEGRETIRHFSPEELEAGSADEMESRKSPDYVRSRGILDDVELFDASFFGINPKEADILDPQQRLFMEASWEALEDAGCDPQRFSGAIGVFAGMSNNTYFLHNLLGRKDVTDVTGWLTTMMGNEKDYLATRLAYKLDLRGPALNIQTACSTSLVAVCAAFQSLIGYQCDIALAGGVSVMLPQRRGYLYDEGAITSPDGHCRAFDAKAAGTVFSNGLGVVVLKRLRDALEDGDSILAVVKGSALNNDGSAKVSFTAPSVDGHAQVISLAQALAGIDPDTITYVEAHGTGTPLGDPIEIAGLTQAFRSGGATRHGYCALGSVKTNMGHLDAAAGVAGLIKAALALRHKTLPASLHFESPNPKLDLAKTPFFVNAARRSWAASAGHPRRAGVSSFGVGGTNAHVVLEEAPPATDRAPAPAEQLLVLSARSVGALEEATRRLSGQLESATDIDLRDIAFTLQAGRRRFAQRKVLVCRGRQDALALLSGSDPKRIVTTVGEDALPRVAFLFPGQGAQYVGMGRGLYESEPMFRAEVDACAEVLRDHLGDDLRAILYPAADREASAKALTQTAITQPALFVIEYALARLWESWGLQPDAMIGHSLGEYVAATLSGVFSRDDALALVARRARLMQDQPAGSMLAVRAPAEALEPMLSGGLSIAAVNSPVATVVSGTTEAVNRFEDALSDRNLPAKRLATSHAFHSSMMEPVLETFASLVAKVERRPPSLTWVSCLTGRFIEPSQATDPAYWAAQMRQPVLFARGVESLFEAGDWVTLEVGPGQGLTTLARQTLGQSTRTRTLATSLPPASGATTDREALLGGAGALWAAGRDLDWRAFCGPRPRKVALPTYPFERKRHWVEPAIPPAFAVATPPPALLTSDLPLSPPPRIEETMSHPPSAPAASRRTALTQRLRSLFAELSGIEASALDPAQGFLELGLDSLFLTQAAGTLLKAFGVKVAFRDLLESLSTIDALAAHLDTVLPAQTVAPPAAAAGLPLTAAATSPASRAMLASAPANTMERLIAEQLELMRQQLAMLRGEVVPAAVPPETLAPPPPPPATPVTRPPAAPVVAFGPYRPPAKGPTGGLTPAQETWLKGFVTRYAARTAGSKKFTATNRSHLADPRSVAGFRLMWKEMVYPIVTERSAGSRLWDIDGNEYVDLANGFGMILFGHNPAFIREALNAQLERGIEIGPQTPLAGEVASRVATMVGLERVAFCNTGSEAVTAAIRVARTVSGRDKIAMFAGAYHGIFDEVLVRPAGGRSLPIAPGIAPNMVENIAVLEYGSPEALDYVRLHGSELAAVLVEPVQSRRPELQPRAFLHELRRLTAQTGSALVFDEVVTGFRTHPRGAQAIFGVQADIATYGKVIGGGLPIGLVAGDHRYLDALDGGAWSYGDDSSPEVGVTFFAGTFVRHPLALAACRAVLGRLEAEGEELQRGLNRRTTRFVEGLNACAERLGAPIRVTHFSSWFCFNFPHDVSHASLFFALIRSHGVHLWEGRPGFLTTAHTDADLEHVTRAFERSVAEMQDAGFLPGGEERPPVLGARRGHDPGGREAWFVPDPDRPGKYLQVEEAAATRG